MSQAWPQVARGMAMAATASSSLSPRFPNRHLQPPQPPLSPPLHSPHPPLLHSLEPPSAGVRSQVQPFTPGLSFWPQTTRSSPQAARRLPLRRRLLLRQGRVTILQLRPPRPPLSLPPPSPPPSWHPPTPHSLAQPPITPTVATNSTITQRSATRRPLLQTQPPQR